MDEVYVIAGQASTPTISSLTPNHGQTGTTVTIAGSNLGSGGTVRFGSTTASPSAWSPTSITCTVPASLSPGAVNVTVTPAGGSASNALSFTVDSPPATPKPVEWSISGQPKTVRYKGAVTISGALRDAVTRALIPNRRGFLIAAEDTGDADSWEWGFVDSASGQFAAGVYRLERRTYFQWFSEEDSTYEAGVSDWVKIMARAKLTAPGFAKVVRRGKRVTARGTLWPKHTAGQNTVRHTRVEIYRYSRGKYRKLGSVWAKASSTTSATRYTVSKVRFSTAGRYRARAIHQDADHAKTTSSWRSFRVK